jgi:hypothetical protein
MDTRTRGAERRPDAPGYAVLPLFDSSFLFLRFAHYLDVRDFVGEPVEQAERSRQVVILCYVQGELDEHVVHLPEGVTQQTCPPLGYRKIRICIQTSGRADCPHIHQDREVVAFPHVVLQESERVSLPGSTSARHDLVVR